MQPLVSAVIARALVELGLGASEGEVRGIHQYSPTSIDQCLDTMDDVQRLRWPTPG